MTLDLHDRLPDDLELLYVPVPADLAELLGYHGSARLVAFYWNFAVDSLAYHDGINRGVGESLRFLEYAGHPNVEGQLTKDIGLCEQPGTHWLLLDRQADNLYVAIPDLVRRILIDQHERNHLATVDGHRYELAHELSDTLNDEDPILQELVCYLDRWNADDTT